MPIFQTAIARGHGSLNPVKAPRRRIDREVTPGRCGNLDYCSLGMQRVLVQVPLNKPFVCPECAAPLRPPAGRSIGGRPLMLPVLRLAVLLTATGVSLAAGYMIGRLQPTVGAAVALASRNAGAGLDAAKSALGLPVGTGSAFAMPASGAPVAARPAAIFVAERDYPAKAPSVDVSKPAARLPHEARFGQVTIDCTTEEALIHAACQVTDIRGADPFSAAAVVWLQSLAVTYGPGARSAPSGAHHRWRVVFEDFSGAAHAARQPR